MKRTFDRDFQLWEYIVSHGMLHVRSPLGPDHATNVDLVFAAVAYISAPTHLPQLSIDEPTAEEATRWTELCGNRWFAGARVFVLVSGGVRHFVVAARLQVSENSDELFLSPFEFGPIRPQR